MCQPYTISFIKCQSRNRYSMNYTITTAVLIDKKKGKGRLIQYQLCENDIIETNSIKVITGTVTILDLCIKLPSI